MSNRQQRKKAKAERRADRDGGWTVSYTDEPIEFATNQGVFKLGGKRNKIASAPPIKR